MKSFKIQNMKKDRSALVEFVKDNANNIDKLPDSFKDYFNENKIKTITIENWINNFQLNNDIITIDLRSESEYNHDKLPNSINFPILDDKERDEVGFLYKQFSPKAALFLAVKYADEKEESIKTLVKSFNQNTVFVYCWRGGGRSTAGYTYFEKYGAKVVKIGGGYKSYRNMVYNQFYTDERNRLEKGLLILTGLTGCGKTQILEKMNDHYPVLDIEKAAGHASSLFGHIRYDLKHITKPLNQSNFENNLFTQIISRYNTDNLPFLSEGESKRISTFNIPDFFYQKLILSPAIKINSSIDQRIEIIKKEYFSGDGGEAVYNTINNSSFFNRLLGHNKTSKLLELLRSNRNEEFIEWILLEYYDKRYAGKYKNIIAEIDNSNIDDTIGKIVSIMNEFF